MPISSPNTVESAAMSSVSIKTSCTPCQPLQLTEPPVSVTRDVTGK